MVEKEGIPTFYIRELADIDDYIKNVWEDKAARKKLSKDRSRALTTLRQRLGKYFRDEENAVVVKRVEEYRLNPEESEEEEEKEEEVDSDKESEDDERSLQGLNAKNFKVI